MGIAKYMIAAAAAVVATANAQAQELRADQAEFRELYAELVNTNTAFSNGNCTIAAEQLAKRMWDAGYSKDDAKVIVVPGFEREGNLVAILQGTSKTLKPMLLLAHIDVVEARREDWTRDPFMLVEEDGFFYARGVADDKAQAAMWIDSLIRLKKEGYKPKRTIKLAATCGEESNAEALNGAEWLARNMPDSISAEFALNEGGGGRVDKNGNRQFLAMQVGEKATRTFDLQTTNPGGHSSVPRPDNAIYDLAEAVVAIKNLGFPVQLNATTRAFLQQYSATAPAAAQKAIADLLADESNVAAGGILSAEPVMNATLRTTCVTTMLEAGHAANALPQRAKAVVNCRIVPGMSTEEAQAAIEKAIANPRVKVTLRKPHRPMAVAPPLDKRIMDPAMKVAGEMFPGVPLIPIMATGATDATMTALIGIPTYGIPGIFYEADGGGVHGLNERIRTKSVYDGRDYLHRLVKLYAEK
ncbi:M20/M25/M40 family metallo-hydrolase [Sphingorhabdus sp.]|jgi:acetylornithine deacetylase/succinyl-diaminopimelate desuccinylase-like protein|uniref:M20/M25/M40 family metallo-hydrolase n=1 Tax=Sphingorhabdus sp. TaxID=1902408 RepID=UPI0037C8E716